MLEESKSTDNDQFRDTPLIGIDTELQAFVQHLSCAYGMSFDDVLNATLRIGMRHLSGLLFAERIGEVLENIENPGLQKDFGAIIAQAIQKGPGEVVG